MNRPARAPDRSNFKARARSWKNIRPGVLKNYFFYKASFFWKPSVVWFLNSNTDLDPNEDWRPIRPLGQGGYGIVGLWQRHDKHGAVEESIAIKQQKYISELGQAAITVQRTGEAKEAALMRQLNYPPQDNIIWLKLFRDHQWEKLWRFYFEFAEWGDLRTLQSQYRAWNTYLPEEFLWHLFHGMVAAALRMEDGPFRDLETNKACKKDEAWVVHFDWKPENVFLADPVDTESHHFSNYPCIKVADFGLAVLTGTRDMYNPVLYRSLGTPGYQPPEQILRGAHWRTRPEDHVRRPLSRQTKRAIRACQERERADLSPGYQFTSAHNVWCIGLIMWELLTLRTIDSCGRELDDLTEEQYHHLGQEAIAEITTKRVPEYPLELRELIRQCLRPWPEYRPDVRVLYDTTKNRVLGLAQKLHDDETGLKNGPRLYYMGHEINDMPLALGQRPLGEKGAISDRKAAFLGGYREKFRDPGLVSLLRGRWDPALDNDNTREKPVVRGGPRLNLPDVAFVHKPDAKDPSRVIRAARPADDLKVDVVGPVLNYRQPKRGGSEDEDEDDEYYVDGESSDDSDDDDGGDDEQQGPPGGGGKTRGSSGGRVYRGGLVSERGSYSPEAVEIRLTRSERTSRRDGDANRDTLSDYVDSHSGSHSGSHHLTPLPANRCRGGKHQPGAVRKPTSGAEPSTTKLRKTNSGSIDKRRSPPKPLVRKSPSHFQPQGPSEETVEQYVQRVARIAQEAQAQLRPSGGGLALWHQAEGGSEWEETPHRTPQPGDRLDAWAASPAPGKQQQQQGVQGLEGAQHEVITISSSPEPRQRQGVPGQECAQHEVISISSSSSSSSQGSAPDTPCAPPRRRGSSTRTARGALRGRTASVQPSGAGGSSTSGGNRVTKRGAITTQQRRSGRVAAGPRHATPAQPGSPRATPRRRPPRRNPNLSIIQQALPELEARNVGGRRLRERKR